MLIKSIILYLISFTFIGFPLLSASLSIALPLS